LFATTCTFTVCSPFGVPGVLRFPICRPAREIAATLVVGVELDGVPLAVLPHPAMRRVIAGAARRESLRLVTVRGLRTMRDAVAGM
jgi:hypothetical protein